MSQFEFLMMIASVVVAVAITEVIGGWGRILRNQSLKVELDWLHLGACITSPLIAVQYWMGMWSYNAATFTSNFQILMLVLPSAFSVLSAFIITPDVGKSDELNCRDYYMSRRKPFYLTGAAFILSASAADFLIVGSSAFTLEFVIIFGLGSAVSLYLAWTPKVWVHGTVLVVGFIQLAAFYTTEFATLNARFL